MALDQFLIDRTPGPTVAISPAVAGARGALLRAVASYLTIDDGALERPWDWRPDEPGGETDVRYGLYRGVELLDAAAMRAGRLLDEAGVVRPAGARIVAPATAARWELHGVLAPLRDADLDRDPGGGEWTIRQTLAHMINAQRAYCLFTAWWLGRVREPEFPPAAPDDAVPGFPEESAEGEGTLAEIRARLDEIMDTGAGRLGGLDDRALAARARWSGFGVDVGFRLARWASHIREHTVQIDKTFVMLDRRPTEVERLVRLVAAGYGRLEATVFALPPDVVESAGAASVVEGAGAELEALAGEVAAAVAAAR